MESKSEAQEITYISIGIAAMVIGGFVIFQISAVFPIPGVKFILMSPYLSMVIYMLLRKLKGRFALLKLGSTLGLVLSVISLYMGLAIVLTSLATQVSILVLPSWKRPFSGAILFSAYTGFCALLVSKYLVGGVFLQISLVWMILTGFICLISGVVGTLLAKKIMKHLVKSSYQ